MIKKKRQLGGWNQASFIGFKLNKTLLADKNHTPGNSTLAGVMKTNSIETHINYMVVF